jgi:DNA excision repair protein ERCC-4
VITISFHHTETRSGIPAHLIEKAKDSKYRSIRIKENKENEIDYIIGEGVGVERKSMDDLASSIQQHKIPSQLKRIIDNDLIPIFLVEGIVPNIEQSQMAWESVYGYISFISQSGIVVFHTLHQEHTATRLLNAALAFEDGMFGHLEVPVIKSKSDHPTLASLMALPDVGEEMAYRIRERFNSRHHLLMTCYKQLREGRSALEQIDGIGHKTARKIAKEYTKSW